MLLIRHIRRRVVVRTCRGEGELEEEEEDNHVAVGMLLNGQPCRLKWSHTVIFALRSYIPPIELVYERLYTVNLSPGCRQLAKKERKDQGSSGLIASGVNTVD